MSFLLDLEEVPKGSQWHSAEQTIDNLREAEVLQDKGIPMEEIARQLGISDAT